MDYLTPADLLVRGLGLGPLAEPPQPTPPGTTCCLTGQPITHGYPRRDMTTGATAEFLDGFRGDIHGWLSDAAARCFKNADPRKGNPTARSILAFEKGDCWQPLINQESAAEQGRACWRNLVREIWPERRGERCLVILTTDTKKRLWPRARVGALGPRTPVLVYDSKLAANEVRLIDWPTLLDCLALIEQLYSQGFVKEVIRHSLYSATKAIQAFGVRQTRDAERQLAGWRNRPEFTIALLMAQKDEPAEQAHEGEKDDNPSGIQPDRGLAQPALL